MRISWLSNAPWAATGYGNQTGLFVPRLKALGHDMQVTAYWGLSGAVLDWQGIKIYPGGYHPYGQDIAGAHAQHFRAEALISLMDAWVCSPENYAGVPWLAWFPVDSEPLPSLVREKIEKAHTRLVFSHFGERMVNEAGLDCHYIPHGVDTNILRPTPGGRKRFGLPDDAFVVGMVAANKGNPSRKGFDTQLAGFAEFAKKHKDAILYLHTNDSRNGENGGVDIIGLCKRLGLEVGENVRITQPYDALMGYPPALMAELYSAFDVHLLASWGEGFGIPTVEAQACGCPVIVGDWTASGELCFSGWKIPKTEANPVYVPLGSWQYSVRPGAVADALEQAYNMRGNQDYRDRARKGALAYDADKVTEKYWKPFLEAYAAR